MMTVDGNTAAKTKECELVDPRNLEFNPMWSSEHGRFAALTQLELMNKKNRQKEHTVPRMLELQGLGYHSCVP